MINFKNLTNNQIAESLDELAAYFTEEGDYFSQGQAPGLYEAATRLRAATEPGAGIRAVYEKWKHRDRDGMMSNWSGYPPGEEMFYEFWAAIKAEVEYEKSNK